MLKEKIKRKYTTRVNRGMLYIRTVSYLKWIQVYGRLKICLFHTRPRFYQGVKKGEFKSLLIPELDLDEEFLSRFIPDELINNEITLIGQKESLHKGKWFYENRSPLWNFNLNYFEYGIAMAARYRQTGEKRYKQTICEWIENWCETQKKGVCWHPYTISLRIPNWILIYELLKEEPAQKVMDSMYSQYRYLIRNQEIHLLGNHYLENLKAILLGSLYFDEQQIFNKYWPVFVAEVEEEVLDDGVHFERSLMYHKIIMEDIMRLMKMMGKSKANVTRSLEKHLKQMATALYSLEKGMGKTPHFNDAADGVAKNGEALLEALKEAWGILPKEKVSFECAGYYKLYSNSAALMFDCGDISPAYMAGHGHCDALSFELSMNEKPILVNSGTYGYQGSLRPFFRSTRAHNTAVIHGCEQSELWGEHRAARRIRDLKCSAGKNFVEGEYKTYHGFWHSRMIKSLQDGRWQIEDRIVGPEHASVSVYFHAFPGLVWSETAQRRFRLSDGRTGILELQTEDTEEIVVHRSGRLCSYSQRFGSLQKKEVLELRFKIRDGGLFARTRINISGG